ncbi:MAG: MFS transporter [Sphaerochaetaceae bacterium]|nr:MFS transporter [Sphaerochaetaceae bacterium]
MIILIALFFCISILVTPEDPNIKVKVKKEKEPFSFKFFSSSYYLMLFIIAITRIGNSVIDRLLSSYMVEVLNVGSRFTLFVALGAFSEMFMLIFGSKLVQKGKTSPWFMIVLSTAGLFLRLLLFRFSKNLGIFALAQVFHMFTFGALHVGITAFMTENVEPQHYTLAMSFYWSVASFFPLSIGSFFGGFIIDAFGYDTLFTTYMVFPLIALFMLFIFKNFLTGKKKE